MKEIDAETQLLLKRLCAELWRQWEYNHAEHCGKPFDQWSHDGVCYWPVPEVLRSARTARLTAGPLNR